MPEEPVAQLFTYEDMLEKLYHLESIVNRVHQLAVSPDFRVSGGLVKVSSLEAALEGPVRADPAHMGGTSGEYIALKIDELADAEAQRTEWDGRAGELGNWVNGIREGARHIRRGFRDAD